MASGARVSGVNGVEFKPDHAAIGRWLRSAEVAVGMKEIANKVKHRAEEIAPVYAGADRDADGRGSYKRSFHIRMEVVPVQTKHGRSKRAAAIVYNTDPQAWRIEFGSRNNPRHNVLWRAIGKMAEGD